MLRSRGCVDARVIGGAKLCRDLLVVLARILACSGRNLGGQQDHDQPILVSGPHRAVSAKKACSCALFSSEAAGAVDEARHKPLEANRDFTQLTAEFLYHTVNHAAAHHGFSNRNRRTPFGPMRHEITNGHGEVVVRVHQAGQWSDNPVAVGVGVVAERNLILIFQAHQPRHRIRAGTIHADFPVVVDSHERKSWVDGSVDDLNVQSMNRVNRVPVRKRCPTKRVYAQLEMAAANGVDVDDVAEIANIGREQNRPDAWSPLESLFQMARV